MWWRYDDETVTQLGRFPVGDPSDHGSANAGALCREREEGVPTARPKHAR